MCTAVKSGLLKLHVYAVAVFPFCKGNLMNSLDLSVPLVVVPSDCSLYDPNVFKILPPPFMNFCFSLEKAIAMCRLLLCFQAAF